MHPQLLPSSLPSPVAPKGPGGFPPTEEQQAVIDTIVGEIYVMAAAGSGKTATAITRTRNTGPNTLILTYNKAASVVARTRLQAEGIAGSASTVHSYCLSALRRRYPRAPWTMKDKIVGVPGGISGAELMFKAFRACDWDGEDWREAHEAYSTAREAMAAGEPFESTLQRALQSPTQLAPASVKKWYELFAAYEEEKRKRHGMDFADMISITLAMVAEEPTFAPHYLIGDVQHLVLDEGQDANEARWALLDVFRDHLLPRGGSVLAVFDTRQSIYSFQGARPDLATARMKRPGVTVLHLTTTFRNTPQIVEVGNEIARGSGLPDSVARPGAPDGPVPEVWGYPTVTSEIQALAERISDGPACNAEHTVVLARANSLLVNVECGLVRRGIRFVRQDGTTSVWTTQPGALLLAYVRTFERGTVGWDTLEVVAKPNRFVKKGDLVRLLKANDGALSLHALHAEGGALARFARDLQPGCDADTPKARVDHALEFLLSALRRGSKTRPRTVASDDIEAIYKVLGTELARHRSADHAVAAFEMAAGARHTVGLSTIHAAKGLEWDRVFVIGVSKDVLPHKRAFDVEEERRLLYVAVTRAKTECVLSWSNKISPLLLNLPAVRHRERMDDE